jgi:hypothetical protein
MDGNYSSLYPLLHDPNYRFLFCTLCRYAVLVPSISDHLKGVHKDVPADRRKAVRENAGRLEGMYQRKEEAAQFQFPSPSDAPIPHIRAPVDNGLQCEHCRWITTSPVRRKTHRHPGIRPRWRANVRCQQLFAKGPRSVWFEVGQDDGAFTSDGALTGEDSFTGELTAWLNEGNELRTYASRLLVYAY